LQLSDEERALRVPGGTQVLFRHRTNWAHDRLKRAGLSSAPRRGMWQLTSKGAELARTRPETLPRDEILMLAKAGRDTPMHSCLPANEHARAPLATERNSDVSRLDGTYRSAASQRP
jgi:restriction system protein